jgi:hypothetical protein
MGMRYRISEETMTERELQSKVDELNKLIETYNETVVQFYRSRNESYRDAIGKLLLEQSSKIAQKQAEIIMAIANQMNDDPADWWKNGPKEDNYE